MDFIGHYFIAVLVGLAVFGRKDWKKVLAFSLFALLPDLDFAFGLHRMLFHNVFFAVIAGFAVFAVLRVLRIEKALKYGAFSFLGVFSHLLLDLGKPGIAVLYPFLEKAVYLEFYISLNVLKLTPYLKFGIAELGKETLGFCCEMERAFLSGTTTVILLFFLLALAVQKIREKNGK